MQVEQLAKDLKLQRVKIKDDEIMASCPFAKISHATGIDSHPSFSINIEKGVYNCFTCGARGIIEDLVAKTFNMSMAQAIDYLEELGMSKLEIAAHSYIDFEEEEEVVRYIPEMVLENFTLIKNFDYEMYEGKVEDQDCLIYVVRDYKHRLVGALARSKEGRFHKNLWHMKKKYFLLGEQNVKYYDPLVIVEGPGDMLAIKKSGWANVVALMGASLSVEQADKIERFTDDVIVWLDRDKAGFDGTYRVFNMLDDKVDLRFVDTSQMKDDEKDSRDVLEKRGSDAVYDLILHSMTYLEQLLEDGGFMEDKD
jgi:DNA primase